MTRGGWAVLAVLAACGGREPTAAAPAPQRPRLQLIACQPAQPPPILEDDGETFGGLRRERPVDAPSSSGDDGSGMAISADDFRRVMRGQRAALAACSEADPKGGRIGPLEFTIEPDGSVDRVTIGGASDKLAVCIGRALRAMKFPPPKNGATVRVRYPLTESAGDSTPSLASAPSPSPPPPPPAAWTPFALSTDAAGPGAQAAAQVAENAVLAQRDALEACFPGPAPTGSLRVMLDLDDAGAVRGARAGGLGDTAAEACVAKALSGLHVAAPVRSPVELACDLSRGDAQAWRVDPGAYEVIDATRTGAVHRGARVAASAPTPDPLAARRTFLVVADRDASGAALELALAWATDGDGTLVALRDDPRPPLLVGVGRSGVALGSAHEAPDAAQIAFDLAPDRLTACVRGFHASAPLSAPAEVDAVLARAATQCRAVPCTGSAGLAIDVDATAAAVADTVAALHRAGFSRVLLGAGIGCGFSTAQP